MNDIAIRVVNLGKQYRIGARQTGGAFGHRPMLHERLTASAKRLVQSPFSKRREKSEVFWALQDISFEVKQGEAVGIIGHNGAGKSTLLKILSRITEPSIGYADICGRLSSLLEVGTGFHPELTGRENIYLNAAILGMTGTHIARKFDEIVAFAEVEKFIDTPAKNYSTGMYLRLAFSVAAHLEPEILLVDEVLAVGDASFQKKCLGKMEDVAKAGRTVLFVSHNMAAVERLCQKVVWLQNGQVHTLGEASEVVSNYLRTSLQTITEQVWDDIHSAPGNEKIKLHRVCIRPAEGPASGSINIRTPYVIEFDYWNRIPEARLDLSFHLYNEQGIMVFNHNTYLEPTWHGRGRPKGLFRSTCFVPGDLMNDGEYKVSLVVTSDQATAIYKHPDLLAFTVLDATEMRNAWHGRWPGAVRPNLQWQTELLELDA
ncbi:MAG TPA: ABC transporter ATP-binding protein [Verrucomicrobiae bacterium]|nr:ABC transporter ATP-binding protein [Verrucomicrobiae bacterium]